MWILLGLALMAAVGIALVKTAPPFGWRDSLGALTTAGGFIGLFCALLALPLAHLETHAQIGQVESVRASLASAREGGQSIENAALQLKVVEANQRIARQQYWNKSAFGLWVPDAVERVEVLR